MGRLLVPSVPLSLSLPGLLSGSARNLKRFATYTRTCADFTTVSSAATKGPAAHTGGVVRVAAIRESDTRCILDEAATKAEVLWEMWWLLLLLLLLYVMTLCLRLLLELLPLRTL